MVSDPDEMENEVRAKMRPLENQGITWEDPRVAYPELADREDTFPNDELTEALNELAVLRMKCARHQGEREIAEQIVEALGSNHHDGGPEWRHRCVECHERWPCLASQALELFHTF